MPLALVQDLVGEAPASPRGVRLPDSAALHDLRANAVDDLLLAIFRQFGVEHDQDLVIGHGLPYLLPSV